MLASSSSKNPERTLLFTRLQISGAVPGEYRSAAWLTLIRELGTQGEPCVAWLSANRRDRNKKRRLLVSSLVITKWIVPIRLKCSLFSLSFLPLFSSPFPPFMGRLGKSQIPPLPPIKGSWLFLGNIWYLKSVPNRFSSRVLPSHMMSCISRLFNVSSKPTLSESCDYVRVSTQFLK